MEKRDWGRRIGSVLVLVIFVTVLSCFAGGKLRREAAEKEGNFSAAGSLEENEPQTKEEGIESAAGDAESAEKDSESKEGVPVFGRGMECEESLAEEVVTAMKNGDTESLIGVKFGEEFDYDVYEDMGGSTGRSKELAFEYSLEYLFEGKGHRFSGFSISRGKEPFLGIRLGGTPASIFVKAFGEPDHCEVSYDDWENAVLWADWYFDKAVLTVKEREGHVDEIEYRALGDAADGGEDSEKPSDFELRMEKRAGNEKAEIVYDWEFSEYEKDMFYPSEEDDTGAHNREEFVERYLETEGFGGREPESVIYDEEGQVFAQGYMDEIQGKFCFIIYDFDKVCCAVRNLSEARERGRLIYAYDEAGNTVQETQYDIWEMKMAEISCTYHDGFPFPFLTESWNTRYEGYDELCRNQKTWFYEEDAEFDRQGRAVSVTNDHADAKSYLWYPCHFTYRRDGKLKKIQEEIPEDRFCEEDREYREGYYGDMEFTYSEKGKLKKAEYEHSSYFYGTGDQSGTINFDEQERMVRNHYYITSGCHDDLYFYRGDEKRPWAVLDWCDVIRDVDVYRPSEDAY